MDTVGLPVENAGASAPVTTSTPESATTVTPRSNGLDFIDKTVDETAAAIFKSDADEGSVKGSAPSEAEASGVKDEKAAAAPSTEKPAESTEATATDKPAIEVPAGAPKTWKPEAAAIWDKIPPEAQAEIQRREADMFKGIEQYKGAAEVGNKYQAVMAPYADKLKQYNVDPVQMTANLVKIHERLSFGTQEEREQIIGRVARDYGVDLAKLGAEQSYIDPEVQKLKDEVARLKGEKESYAETQRSTEFQTYLATVEEFGKKPENIYFNEVIEDMIPLLQNGIAKDIADAYHRAVRLNPVTWAKEEARIRTEAADKALKDEQARLAKLSHATSANIQTQENGSGTTVNSAPTMEETMAETLRDIKKRING